VDIEAMIDATCSMLRLMVDGQAPPTSEISVPFQLHHFAPEDGGYSKKG
jgi:hypothetical protein